MRFKSAYSTMHGKILSAIRNYDGIKKSELKKIFFGWPTEHFEKTLDWLQRKNKIRIEDDRCFIKYEFEMFRK